MADITTLSNLVDPQVLAEMIGAKLEKKIKIIPYAKLDTTLQGRAGSTVTIPKFTWDGQAELVAEGAAIPLRNLGTSTVAYTVSKAGIGGEITDEAALSGFGDPVGALGNGIAKSILAKCDGDAMSEMLTASTIYDANTASVAGDKIIGYNAIVNSIDLFEEEENSEKVTFIHPLQVTALRLDSNFIDKTKYGNEVMVSGEIGMVANSRIVPSKRVAMIGGCFYNPIVKLTNDIETEDDMPAITYYIKRGTNVEVERKARYRKTEITGDQMYVVALTNDSKIVILKANGAPFRAINMYAESYTYPGTVFAFNTKGVTYETKHTGANAEKLTPVGTAPLMSATVRDGLGFDASATNAFVALLPIPGAPLNGFVATEVYKGSTALAASDIMVVDNVPYVIVVKAIWDDSGTLTSSNATIAIKYGASGTATTYTYDFSKIKLAV